MAEHRYRTKERVEFADTDLAGIVHFSRFCHFVEKAEHAFYRSLGFSVAGRKETDPERQIGWPRIQISFEFRKPLEFEEEFEVEILVEKIGIRTIDYRTRVWKENGELAATGKMGVICVRSDESGKMRAAEIPQWVLALIEEAPVELLESGSSGV